MKQPAYQLKLGPVVYEGYRDGTPFTLVDCFREAYGVGQATIIAPTGPNGPNGSNS